MGASESVPQTAPEPEPTPAPPAMVTLSAVCPPNAGPGSRVRVQHAGQMFEVAVPAGVAPGGAFKLQVPAPDQSLQDIYSGSGGAAYPGLRSPSAVQAARRAPPTSTQQTRKLSVGLVIRPQSLRLGSSGDLSLVVDCACDSRLTIWQAVAWGQPNAELHGAEALPSHLEKCSREGQGASVDLCAGAGQQCKVQLPCLATAVKTAAAANQPGEPVYALAVCLQAAAKEPDESASQAAAVVRAALCFCTVKPAEAANEWDLAESKRQLVTFAGQLHTLQDVYGLGGRQQGKKWPR